MTRANDAKRFTMVKVLTFTILLAILVVFAIPIFGAMPSEAAATPYQADQYQAPSHACAQGGSHRWHSTDYQEESSDGSTLTEFVCLKCGERILA